MPEEKQWANVKDEEGMVVALEEVEEVRPVDRLISTARALNRRQG